VFVALLVLELARLSIVQVKTTSVIGFVVLSALNIQRTTFNDDVIVSRSDLRIRPIDERGGRQSQNKNRSQGDN
jgi:hypothetical protein